MGIDIDTSEVRALAHDMARVDSSLTRHLTPVVKKGATNIKKTMQADLRQSSNAGFQYVARTVSFDLFDSGLTAEIGPSKPLGALANVAYFGTSRGGGTVRDPREALNEEADRFVSELEKMAEGLVLND